MNTIYTIGYEGTDIKSFIETLKNVGIEVIADVHAVPLSRKKGFSKAALDLALTEVGIKYIPFKELGDPKPGREAARAGNYAAFGKIYSDFIKNSEADTAIVRLAECASAKKTCMLCFERDYRTCHRNIIARKLIDYGFSSFNLYADNSERYKPYASLSTKPIIGKMLTKTGIPNLLDLDVLSGDKLN